MRSHRTDTISLPAKCVGGGEGGETSVRVPGALGCLVLCLLIKFIRILSCTEAENVFVRRKQSQPTQK